MKAVIFVGPSLSVEEGRRILDAVYLPPAKQGDVVSAVYRFHPDVIGIVDAAQFPDLAVWHKDILFALENGVAVYGAAGIGALRAIETGPAGMVGVGRIFEDLGKRGIFGDDEVMCRYEKRAGGYVRLSEPLVNLRATLEAARDAGIIDAATGERLAAAAKAVPYGDRHIEGILRNAAEQGVPAGSLGCLEAFFKDHYVDLQKQDAITLLETIKGLPRPEAPTQNRSAMDDPDPVVLHVLKYRDRDVSHEGMELPLYALADFVAVHHPATDVLIAQARNRYLAQCLADFLHVQVSDREIAEEEDSFRAWKRLSGEDDFRMWIAKNDLCAEDFHELMKQNACIRKLHQWAMTRLGLKRFTKVLLDELRLNDEYRQWAGQAAETERACQEDWETFVSLYRQGDVQQLAAEHLHAQSSPWHRQFFDVIRDAGLSPRDLMAVLVKTKMARDRVVRKTCEAAEDGILPATDRS